jgi:hypothetical protein
VWKWKKKFSFLFSSRQVLLFLLIIISVRMVFHRVVLYSVVQHVCMYTVVIIIKQEHDLEKEYT